MKSRIAVFSDVHANLSALTEVLREIKGHDPDRIYHGGDLVDCGVQPKEVCNLLRDQGILGVRGNHDEAAALNDPFLVGLNKNPDSQQKVRSFLEWTHHRLSIENRRWLLALPHTIEIAPGVLLVHATPQDNKKGIKPSEVAEKAPKAFAAAGPRVHTIICGHTHRPINKKLIIHGEGGETEKHLINVGSVGLPRHGRPQPMYVILEIEGADVDAKFYEVKYDHEAAAQKLEEVMGDQYVFAERIRTGH